MRVRRGWVGEWESTLSEAGEGSEELRAEKEPCVRRGGKGASRKRRVGSYR